MKYVLSSPYFKNGEMIPVKYTCDGENVSPELIWQNPPAGTHSFVLEMNDFDLPKGKWNHWLIYNIPKDVAKLEEGIITLPKPAKLGANSWRINGYSGPCPPKHEVHNYHFKLYALNTMLNLRHRASSNNIEKIIQQHILDTAVLIGIYKRSDIVNSVKERVDLQDATTILRRKDISQDIKENAKKEIEELSLKPDEP